MVTLNKLKITPTHPILFDNKFSRVDQDLPMEILNFQEDRFGKLPFLIQLGINYDLSGRDEFAISSGLDYRRFPFLQKIFKISLEVLIDLRWFIIQVSSV